MEALRRTFEDVFQEHRDEVQRLIARHTRNPDDALDLTQEVFIRAYGAFSQFRGESSVSTWLYRIAVNVCSNFARSRSKRDEETIEDSELAEYPQSLRDMVEDLAHAEEQRMLKCALRSLSAEQMVALSLRYSDQLTIPEISEVTGSPIDTIKSRLRTALDRLNSTMAFLDAGIVKASEFPIPHSVSLDDISAEGPKGAKIYHGLGSLYLRKGLVEAALLEWKKAQEVEPTFLDPYLASAQQYVKSDRPEKAVDTLEAAVGKIQSLELHTDLAAVYLDIGDLEEGLTHALRALDLGPASSQAHYIAGRAYSKRADLQDALQSLSTGGAAQLGLRGTWKDAARHFRQAVELRPDFGKARSTLAITYFRNNMPDEALREIETAVSNTEDDEFVLYQAGWLHYRANKLVLAERHLRHSLSIRPTPEKAHLLGKILMASDRPEEAFAAFNKALGMACDKRQMPNMYCDLAAAAILLGKYDDAIEAAEAAISIDPDHVHAKCNLSDACLKKGCNPHYVVRLCREGLQTAPEHICFHHFLGEALLRQGLFEEALQEATTAVELEPEKCEWWVLRAKILAKLNQTDKAQSDLTTALELDPQNDSTPRSIEELR